jgi:hypothetical protein
VRFHIDDAGAAWGSFGDPGNNVARHVGQVVISLFVPASAGDGPALDLADQAAAVFRGWAAAGIRFRDPPYVRQVGVSGKWFQLNVLAAFERDSLH